MIRPGDFYGEEPITSANAYAEGNAFDDLFIYSIDSEDFTTCLVESPTVTLAGIHALSGTTRQSGYC